MRFLQGITRRFGYGRTVGCFAALIVAVAALGLMLLRESAPVSHGVVIPRVPPPVSPTRFQNATGHVDYVGSERCMDCHTQEHESWLMTAHSRALQKVQLESEPPDGEFSHEPSGRRYRVVRLNGQMRHQEFMKPKTGPEIMLSDHETKYLVGSGRHTRSYLIEADGFLVQSPITWYASRGEWGMSPGEGYNVPQHWAFERPIDQRCMTCHVGQMTSIAGAPARLEFQALSIDCERCHGPGELHVAKWNSPDHRETGIEDTSIVHPGRLSRQRQEDICAQCHLSGAASAAVRTRSLFDYRPGLSLEDFVVNYEFKTPDRTMRVVGHVDQMRLSRCYQESETLTCTSCHDPHVPVEPANTMEFYRKRCLSCHDLDNCGVAEDTRRTEATGDNCMTCHMPKSPTADIPHIAFTHHRVGLHTLDDTTPDVVSDRELQPIVNNANLDAIDRDRCLGLAWINLSDQSLHGDEFHAARDKGRILLEKVVSEGGGDAEVEAALALCFRHENPARAITYATQALERDDVLPNTVVNLLWIAGSASYDVGRIKQAIPFLERLRQIQRNAETCLLLDICYEQQGRFDDSLQAARQAADISPWRADLQQRLAHLYSLSGQTKLAEEHGRRADQLLQTLGKPLP